MVNLRCPVCGAGYPEWKLATSENYTSGISGKKAILGTVLFGPVGGILGGLSGEKKTAKLYVCTKCGFSHTYTD